jgi:hypothetical protein
MMHWTDLINSLAGLLIVASASSRTIVPLRILAIATNCFLITYFAVVHAWLPMCNWNARAMPFSVCSDTPAFGSKRSFAHLPSPDEIMAVCLPN